MMKNVEFDYLIMKLELPLSSDRSYIDKVHVFVYDIMNAIHLIESESLFKR